MQLLLVYHPDSQLGESWRKHFDGQAAVTVLEADICSLRCDAIVSPANSFGFMDGGLDYALSERFGWDLQKRLQQTIRDEYAGELLVGQAVIVPTNDSVVPWLISAPTMRVPMNITTTVNAYLAMRAILLAVRTHKRAPAIDAVAVPGLGTGVGDLPPDVAALQMWRACEDVVLDETEYPEDVGVAADRHLKLNRLGHLFG